MLSDCKTDSRMQTCGTDLALSVFEILLEVAGYIGLGMWDVNQKTG